MRWITLRRDDDHALEIVRGIVRTLPSPGAPRWARLEPRPPAAAPDSVLDVVPTDTRTPYDIRELLRSVVDGSELQEFKALYGETLVCAFAHIDGHPVGILANNGILLQPVRTQGRAFHRALRPPQHPAAVRAERHRLHGRARLRGGRHRQGRREARDCRGMRNAVPKLTVIVGGSFGQPATTECADVPTHRAFSSCGRTPASA